MPVYTYECENCGQRFDARQSFSDAPLSVCPNCGGKVRRVIQPVGVVFKGSGFYVTDSRGKQNLATSGKKDDNGASVKESDGGTDGAKETNKETGKETAKETGSKSTEKVPAATATPAAPTKSDKA